MAKKLTKTELKKLREAMQHSLTALRPFRAHRKAAIEQYAGANYSDDGATDRVPVNMIELLVNTYSWHLAPEDPRAQVSTFSDELKPMAFTTGLALNHLFKEIRFSDSIKHIVDESIFCVGIAKVGLNRSTTVELGGVYHDIGQPFVDFIDCDDLLIDMTAKRWEDMQFIGNRYRLPIEQVQRAGIFTNTSGLKPMTKRDNEEIPDEGAETISQGSILDPDEYKEMTELWDIYLPQENLFLTLSANNANHEPLLEKEWDGPEGGPYRKLSYNNIPSNIMPLPPVANLMDLHLLGNSLFRKLGRQADRQKDVLLYRGNASDDAGRIREANDGDMVRTDDPKGVAVQKFGGVDQATLAMYLQVEEKHSRYAGNLDNLGGLGPQSSTVGQEQIIAQASSERISYMQGKVRSLINQIISDLAFYLWNDPLIKIPLVKRIPGVKAGIPTTFSAENREGDFFDYNFEIDSYSASNLTPEKKIGTMTEMLTQIFLPFQQNFEQQGRVIDLDTYVDLMARYTNIPEINDMIKSLNPATQQKNAPIGARGSEPRQAPVTTRRTERISRGEGTQRTQNAELTKQLLSTGNQAGVAAGAA